ncbi:MAG: 3-hydroxyacyl-CoA dehydrogenase NAD-binding domain-containing protein, partial [Candidatus Binatia bacterium]
MESTRSGIEKVGVLGIGLMGGGIAQVAATRGFDTVVIDVTAVILEKGMERIRGSLQRLVESHQKSSGKTGVPPEEKENILRRLRASTERRDLLDRDILIEAIVENEPVKKEAISALTQMGYRGVFVSNTSSISITRLAGATPCPEKVMGMHFMNPVPVQVGCEVIRGFLTSEETWERVTAFCRELGKEPIFAEDKAGFGINR